MNILYYYHDYPISKNFRHFTFVCFQKVHWNKVITAFIEQIRTTFWRCLGTLILFGLAVELNDLILISNELLLIKLMSCVKINTFETRLPKLSMFVQIIFCLENLQHIWGKFSQGNQVLCYKPETSFKLFHWFRDVMHFIRIRLSNSYYFLRLR